MKFAKVNVFHTGIPSEIHPQEKIPKPEQTNRNMRLASCRFFHLNPKSKLKTLNRESKFETQIGLL